MELFVFGDGGILQCLHYLGHTALNDKAVYELERIWKELASLSRHCPGNYLEG
jgi:hypothetical protein